MRVKRWLTPPSSRPPERNLRPRAPPRADANLVPPPPSIVSARQFALRSSLRTSLELPTARSLPRDPYRVLGQVLEQLPPISEQPRISLRPAEQVERELATWRKACAVAHAALFGPLRFHRSKFRNSVVRVVGHTMRLLLRMNHVKAARELDRAFFTKEAVPLGTRYSSEDKEVEEEPQRRDEEGDGNTLAKLNGYVVGEGLGLDRGEIRIAWMQSLAVRLRGNELERSGAKEFGQLLHDMRNQRKGQPLNPLLLAFLVRKLENIHAQLKKGGKSRRGAAKEVRQVLKTIKHAESNGEEVVSLALLDEAVERLEKQASNRVDSALYGEVERELELLVGTLDGPLDEDLRALGELQQFSPDSDSVDRQSHILYLTIRFLLFRARHASPPSSLSHPHTLSSASQLYALLLDLSLSASSSSVDLSRVRQRQSSALYRLLWAHLGVFDTHRSPLRTRGTVSASTVDHTLPHRDPSLISSAYDLIELTLRSTSALPRLVPGPTLPPHLPHDPRLVGVSTRFHREALYLLALPSAPSRRDLDSPFPPPPPWCTFRRVFDLISRQRLHDSLCLRHDVDQEAKEGWELDLVVQPAFATHLLRATLLGSTSPTRPLEEYSRTSTMQDERETGERGGGGGSEDTPMSRLGDLVELIEVLEGSRSPVSIKDRQRERKARKLFRKAVDVVVESEWTGEGSRAWRDLVKNKVKRWADNPGR